MTATQTINRLQKRVLPLKPTKTRQEKIEELELKEEQKRRRDGRKLYSYRPYAKQRLFHAASGCRERLFIAGNQLGKTLAGAYETAMHLTGEYPDWWTGRKFTRAIIAWASGVTGEAVRDTTQRLLIGRPGEYGTGAIPREFIAEPPKRAMGTADLLDSVAVKHNSGGVSRLYFKRYEQGREKWQGETLDLVWFDEEPPADIYTEGLTRTNATGGLAMMTFTPLLGMSEIVRRFLLEPSDVRSVVTMTIDDAEHYTPEQRAAIIAAYPPHEREARAKGIPTLGSGKIFPVSEEVYTEQAIQIPAIWPRICGMDFGWDHPTAAAWMAWDRDSDVVHVYDCYRVREATPVIHAAAIKAKGAWIPVAWPHDGLQHDKGSGVQLAEQYRQQGVNMTHERAMFAEVPDDTQTSRSSVEAGLSLMLDMMQTGRLKIAAHLTELFEELRMYHRKDGKINKEFDDIISSVRYGIMMLRYAECKPSAQGTRKKAGSWRTL